MAADQASHVAVIDVAEETVTEDNSVVLSSEPSSVQIQIPEDINTKAPMCRICLGEEEENNKLISPCACSGSIKYIHSKCVKTWLELNPQKTKCELCLVDYPIRKKLRPLRQVSRLSLDRSKINLIK